jgi:Helix-turn-helix domain
VSVLVSVESAAEQLGLNPARVRALVAGGQLAGHKIGGRWVIDDVAIAARLDRRTRTGRPLSARSAWGLLWTAAAEPTPWLAPRERARARERVRDWPIEDWPWVAQHRATARKLRAHPSVLDAVRDDPRSVRSGGSVRHLPIDLVAVGDAELYLRSSDVKRFVADYALLESKQPNVTIRVPPDDLWIFETNDAPWPVVVVDLLESGDDRSARSARQLNKRMRSR